MRHGQPYERASKSLHECKRLMQCCDALPSPVPLLLVSFLTASIVNSPLPPTLMSILLIPRLIRREKEGGGEGKVIASIYLRNSLFPNHNGCVGIRLAKIRILQASGNCHLRFEPGRDITATRLLAAKVALSDGVIDEGGMWRGTYMREVA